MSAPVRISLEQGSEETLPDFSFFGALTQKQSYSQEVDGEEEQHRWSVQAKKLLHIGVPIAGSSIIRVAGGALGLAYAGHYLTRLEFAAIVTGSSLTNITAASLSTGLTCALDALASHCYGELSRLMKLRDPALSRANHEQLEASIARIQHIPGVILRRSIFITCLTFAIVAFLYLTVANSAIALFVSSDDGFASQISYFMRLSVLLPLVLPMMLITCVHRYCQVLQVPYIPTYASAIGLVLMPVFLFLVTAGLSPVLCDDTTGCLETYAVSFALAKTSLLVISVLWMLRHPRLVECLGLGSVTMKDAISWEGWGEQSADYELRSIYDCRFHDEGVKGYLKVGIPSLVSICADLWAFEAFSLIAASLGTTQASLWGLFYALIGVFFSMGAGLAASCSVVVGAAIGARHFKEGFATVVGAIILKYGGGMLVVAGLWIFGEWIYRMFTSDAVLIELGVYILRPAACILMLFDLNGFISQGICRGARKQGFAAITVVGTIWVFSVPMAYVLANYSESQWCKQFVSTFYLGIYDLQSPSTSVVERQALGIVLGATVGMLLQSPIMDIYMVSFYGWAERFSQLQFKTSQTENSQSKIHQIEDNRSYDASEEIQQGNLKPL